MRRDETRLMMAVDDSKEKRRSVERLEAADPRDRHLHGLARKILQLEDRIARDRAGLGGGRIGREAGAASLEAEPKHMKRVADQNRAVPAPGTQPLGDCRHGSLSRAALRLHD